MEHLANLRLNQKSGVPIYLQIANQIKTQIASGEISAGYKLPSIRKLAKDLQINVNTVITAYEHLVKEELIINRQGVGTFVTNKKPTTSEVEKIAILQNLVRQMLVEAKHLRIDDKFLDSLIEQERSALSKKN